VLLPELVALAEDLGAKYTTAPRSGDNGGR
jgi:hypothetical protein